MNDYDWNVASDDEAKEDLRITKQKRQSDVGIGATKQQQKDQQTKWKNQFEPVHLQNQLQLKQKDMSISSNLGLNNQNRSDYSSIMGKSDNSQQVF